MKQSIKLLLGGVFLLSLPMLLTSCEDILGEWSKPTPVNVIVTPDDNGTSTENTYLVWDATAKQLKSEALPTTYTKMDASQTTWSGTYIVEDDVEITSDVTLSGDATIIIKDGKTLSLASDKKIEYTDATAYKLNIHAQSDGASAGKLVVSTTSPTSYYPISLNGSLSIYGASVSTTATGATNEGIFVADELNMYGGELKSTATGNGIMVGNTLGTVNIYGGTVDAKTTDDTGAGPAAFAVYGNMNVYGGTVKGTATATGQGIGVGGAGMGTLTIENGNVTGKGGDGMEGINANTINITGGTVTAENGDGGNGALQAFDNLTISGDETIVNATGGAENTGAPSVGISSPIITIDGGTITATGGAGTSNPGGIGISGTTININNCTKVTATGGVGTSTGECFSGTVTPAATLKYSDDNGLNYTNADGNAITYSMIPKMIIIPQ